MNQKNDFNGIWHKAEYPRTIWSGMRPAFKIIEECLSSGKIECNDPLNDGDLVSVQLISPECYPNSLWPGKIIEAFDGPKKMGTIRVCEIINPLLDCSESE